MKLNGQTVIGRPKEEVAVILRAPTTIDDKVVDNNMYFIAQAVLDFASFESVCPIPQAPRKMRPGGTPFDDVEDKGYQAELLARDLNRLNWVVWNSLKLGTPKLDWEKIDPSSPKTWILWREELADAGLNPAEIQLVENAALTANAFDPDKMDEARNRFLAGRQASQGG